MPPLFGEVLNLLKYKKPDDKSFELLEQENEHTEKYKGGKGNKSSSSRKPSAIEASVDKSIDINLERVKKEFYLPTNSDVKIRRFKAGRMLNAFIVFIDGMVDNDIINNLIMRQLMMPGLFNDFNFNEYDPGDFIIDNVLSINNVNKEYDYNSVFEQVTNGKTAIFLDKCAYCLLVGNRSFTKRNVDKPVTENVVRGAQEGFIENLESNVSQIRRIIRNKNLVTEQITIGQTNKVSSTILYIKEVVNPALIEEIKRRINNIEIDHIAGNGILEQLIEDRPMNIFPQTMMTERPDRTAAFLMDGRAAVLSEGTPFALIVPITFWNLMNTSEDTFLKWQYGTFLRLIRLLGMIFAVLLPGSYVALTLYHQEMIPPELLAAIASSREKVPFPVLIEVLLLEGAFELIREGGIRVPGVIGNTLGIVGALILGQAAVQAGIVSPILVIIVALTGLGNFTIPNYSMTFAIRIVRILFITLGAILGFFGISMGLFIVAIIATSLKSFGMPYFTPVAPKGKREPGLIIRSPLTHQEERPDGLQAPGKKTGSNTHKWTGKNGRIVD